MPAATATAAVVGPPLWLLVFITLSGTLGMHMFVPALAAAAHDMGTSVAAMQMTISLYIAGLAVGQLIYGPLSDAYGRRRLLMGGLTLYCAAGIAAMFAASVQMLIATRLLQALGGCAGLVLGRAIVRDTASTGETVRKLAMLNLMIIIGPGLAPIVGGAIAEHFGWRWIFALLATLGAVAVVASQRLLPETSRPSGRLSFGILVSDYRTLLRSPVFVFYALGGGCATTAIYAFLTAAPFIMTGQLHRPPTELGFGLASTMFGASVGNALTARLVHRTGLQRLLLSGNALSLTAAAALLAVGLSGHLSVGTVLGLMFLFVVGAGLSSPAALTQAISVYPLLTGSAAGLYGCVQMAVGALGTALVSLGRDPAVAAGTVLTLFALIASVSFRIAIACSRSPAPSLGG